MSEQTDLNLILDGIENSDGWTLSLLIDTNAALVKALRRAILGLEASHSVMDMEGVCHAEEDIDDGCPACLARNNLAAILQPSSEPKEKEN